MHNETKRRHFEGAQTKILIARLSHPGSEVEGRAFKALQAGETEFGQILRSNCPDDPDFEDAWQHVSHQMEKLIQYQLDNSEFGDAPVNEAMVASIEMALRKTRSIISVLYEHKDTGPEWANRLAKINDGPHLNYPG